MRITVHTPDLGGYANCGPGAGAHHSAADARGRFLAAGARCRWRPDGPDCNAVLYDADGQIVSEHVLGDGIAHVLATISDRYALTVDDTSAWACYYSDFPVVRIRNGAVTG